MRNMSRGQTFVEPSQTSEIQVHRVGGRGLFRAARFGGGELGVERACRARDDLVLHVEEIGEWLVEPLRPEVTAKLGIDELRVERMRFTPRCILPSRT